MFPIASDEQQQQQEPEQLEQEPGSNDTMERQVSFKKSQPDAVPSGGSVPNAPPLPEGMQPTGTRSGSMASGGVEKESSSALVRSIIICFVSYACGLFELVFK